MDDGYDLDQAAIDIELLAEDNDLAKAMERLADVPQLKIVVAVVSLMERLLPSRGLSAAGELLPAGADGAGVSIALYQGNRLTARSSLWEDEVNMWFPREGVSAKQAKSEKSEKLTLPSGGESPSSHYGLAAPVAWWVQYEAARVLDSNVSLVTNSAPSFSLVGIGLARERQRHVRDAGAAYSSALAHDPDNVAALFNLAQLLAREHGLYAPAALLLVRATEALADRHGSGSPAFLGDGEDGQLRDPTWYRVCYAQAVRCLQIAMADTSGEGKAAGWPRNMSVNGKGAWKGKFSSETQELLIGLFEDQSPVQSPKEALAAAKTRASELLVTVASVLDDAGWHWVGRKPPRYLSWAKRLGSQSRRLARRKYKTRPVAGDEKLTRFLSQVVEPAAVTLYCAAWLAEDGQKNYKRFRAAILERSGGDHRPVDRRALTSADPDQWALDYMSGCLADQQVDTRRHAQVVARLGRTQYRAPLDPAPRARYSFACFLSRLGAEADDRKDKKARDSFISSAAAQLERALSDSSSDRRERLARWARVDPDLSGLRDCNRAVFSTIVARWGPSERRQVMRKKLKSSVISSAAYLAGPKILELELVDGSRYQYFDVPKKVYKALVDDESPGKVFNEAIVPKFSFVRV
ncbi:MAG TPA: KTSC domain-containing protein [Solirubrobacterales bacterium]|nr:KTSC domain-containing protein [Solirubrobacterales bacterium]